MQSGIDQKRYVFRAGLRREYIENYQKKKRMEYLNKQRMQNRSLREQTFPSNQSRLNYIISKLSTILTMPYDDICDQAHFQFMREAVSMVQEEWEHSKFGELMKREKVFDLVYRIIEKVLYSYNQRAYLHLNSLLPLLHLSQFLPLWENLSLLPDAVGKQNSAQQFLALTRQHCSLFDLDFLLDIIYNFVVEQPSLSSDYILDLLSILCGKGLSLQNTPCRINKLALTLKTFLKNSHNSIRLIQRGYQSLYFETVLSLGSISVSCGKLSAVPRTKINVMKLIRQTFQANQEVAFYFYSVCGKELLPLLLQELQPTCSLKQKYQYILCSSHQHIVKQVLATLRVIVSVKARTDLNPAMDFIEGKGLELMRQVMEWMQLQQKPKKGQQQLQGKRQIINIMEQIQRSGIRLPHPLCILYWEVLEVLLQFAHTDLEPVLRLMKSVLLNCYSRATEPELFEQLTSLCLYTVTTHNILSTIIQQHITISPLASDILNICSEPIHYIRQCS